MSLTKLRDTVDNSVVQAGSFWTRQIYQKPIIRPHVTAVSHAISEIPPKIAS